MSSVSLKEKTLFLFTDKYPYGKTQEAYIDNEINYLSQVFKKIIFIPVDCSGVSRLQLDNIEILDLHKNVQLKKWKIWLHLKLIISCLISESKNNKSKGFAFNIKKIFNALCYTEALISYMDANKLKDSHVVLYSYWFYHWSLVSAFVKYRKPFVKAVSRAHLNDLYDEFGNNQFTEFKLSKLSEVFPISAHGTDFLAKKFPKYKSKIKTSYLGVNDLGINNVNYDDKKFVIVSCSAIRKEKRVDKIIETLSYVNFPITWIHFGDGPLMEEIKVASSRLPSNVYADLRGFTPNHVVKEYYLNNQINLFVNFSTAEGIPVSIMEVISFGIPVIATAVYGTPESVPDEVGELIDIDFDPHDVAKRIEEFKNSKKNTKSYRAGVRKYWENNFNADINYTKFSINIAT